MGSRRSAFALIMVLLLVASVFAMTVHSGRPARRWLRPAVVAQHADRRAAQSASSIVLRSIAKANGSGGRRIATETRRAGPGVGARQRRTLTCRRSCSSLRRGTTSRRKPEELDGPGGIVDGVARRRAVA